MTKQQPESLSEAVGELTRQAHEAGLDKRYAAQMRTLAEMRAVIQASHDASPPSDPRWEWVEIPTVGGPSDWVKGACRHLTPEDVCSVVTGEVLARLCPDCDTQLPA